MQQHTTAGSIEERIIYEKQQEKNLNQDQTLKDTTLNQEKKPGFFDKMKDKIHEKFSNHKGETDVIERDTFRETGIHTGEGMPINTGLHTGAALNDKKRLKENERIIDPSLRGTSQPMAHSEWDKDAYLNQQQLQSSTGWEQNVIHGTTGISQTPFTSLSSGMGGGGISSFGNEHLGNQAFNQEGCICSSLTTLGQGQGFQSQLANQPHVMQGTVHDMNLGSSACPIHHSGLTSNLVTNPVNQFSGQIQQPTANFGIGDVMGQGIGMGGGAPIIHQQVTKPTLYHGADFNEPLGSKKLAHDLHDVKIVTNTMPIKQDYNNLPSTDLQKNREGLGLGTSGLGMGTTQLGTGGLSGGMMGQNEQICSTCRGIGKNLCSHCSHIQSNINPELTQNLTQTTGFNKEVTTNMPSGSGIVGNLNQQL